MVPDLPLHCQLRFGMRRSLKANWVVKCIVQSSSANAEGPCDMLSAEIM